MRELKIIRRKTMKQTNEKKYILPDGMALELSTDNGVTFADAGLLAGGITLTHNFDKVPVNGGNLKIVTQSVKNQTLSIAPSALWSQDLAIYEKFGGGLYNRTAVAGTKVEDFEQTVAVGWKYNKFIKITNQNANGSAIVINSVTGATNGALVAETDYFLSQNDKGEYGIIIIDSATVTTENQVVVIDYDYTPAASSYITAGTSSIELNSFQIRMRHYTDLALTTYDLEVYIYSASMDSGLQLNFKGQNEDGLFESTVAFTGELDETRASGDQLFKWLIATSALNV
jgi:hypothetical protein